MNRSVERPTATILQFPVGGHAARAFAREVAKLASTPTPPVIYESAWYHEDAIKDSEPKRPQ